MGSGTSMLTLEYNYHNNNSENIGLGNVYVESDNGLLQYGLWYSLNVHFTDNENKHLIYSDAYLHTTALQMVSLRSFIVLISTTLFIITHKY